MAEAEAVLLRRFAKGRDAEALAEIIRRHAGLVYGTALRILADVDRASDVAQETFLQLTKDAGRITGSLPGWLHRVATHKAIDQMRRDSSRRRREMEYVANQPREATQWKDLSRYVDEGLDELDTETRGILVAHFLQGLTTRQIALLRGVSQATVSRRLDAGITQLRGMLRKRGIIVAAGTLAALFGENAAQAIPAALMAELGKMAIVGGQAAAASATAAAGVSSLETIASGVVTAVKTKAVTVAVVAVVGVGSVATYQEVKRRSADHIVIRSVPRQSQPRLAPRSSGTSGPSPAPMRNPVRAAGPSEAAQKWAELMTAALSQTDGTNGDSPADAAPPSEPTSPATEETPRPPTGGGLGEGAMMGGVAPAPAGPAEPNEQVPPPEMGQFRVGGAGGG